MGSPSDSKGLETAWISALLKGDGGALCSEGEHVMAHAKYTITVEDVNRLRRLSEEIRGRLVEVALIVAHNNALALKDTTNIKFTPPKVLNKVRDASGGDWIEIGEVVGNEYCYGVIGGRPFAESPCGAGTLIEL
jgi:hypothetical protein